MAGSDWRRHSYDTNDGLLLAANYIGEQFQGIGYPVVREQVLAKGNDYLLQSFNSPTIQMAPRPAFNLIAEKTGDVPEAGIIILGAHYDTMAFSTDWEGLKHEQFRPDVAGTPGADDNTSGVAALIAIARELKGANLKRTIRFCAFANEEPPFFQQPDAMGSWAYAAAQKERAKANPREKVVVMISLETMAVYTEQTKNPKRGFVRNAAANIMGLSKSPEYVAFMSNWRGLSTSPGKVAKGWARVFSENSSVPVRCVSLPFFSGEYFAWSDDWSFTRNGFDAFTVTDTAAYRSSRYHEGWDDLNHLTEHDYTEYAKVVIGLVKTIKHFANE